MGTYLWLISVFDEEAEKNATPPVDLAVLRNTLKAGDVVKVEGFPERCVCVCVTATDLTRSTVAQRAAA